jgi:hypothetical protein
VYEELRIVRGGGVYGGFQRRGHRVHREETDLATGRSLARKSFGIIAEFRRVVKKIIIKCSDCSNEGADSNADGEVARDQEVGGE